jgi:hypothetical protein
MIPCMLVIQVKVRIMHIKYIDIKNDYLNVK